MVLDLLRPFVLALVLSLPLAAKWQLERSKALAGAALAGAGATLTGQLVPAATLLGVQVAVVALLLVSMLLFCFHRDPERVPPPGEGLILSPADGRVVYVKEVPAGSQAPTSYKQGYPVVLEELAGSGLLAKGGWLIGIGMNFLDVHVNRAPIRGRVVLSRSVAGGSLSLRRPEALLRNTRRTTVIEGAQASAAIVQITSRLVRHIRPYVGGGDMVEAGQRIGMIRFGSQVDLLLPARPTLRVLCRPQQRVRAGESIIARHGAA